MRKYLDELINRYEKLSPIKDDINKAYKILEECFSLDKKLLLCGNGGSSSDCDHIVGELMKGFVKKRTPKEKYSVDKLQDGLMAINLCAHTALGYAFANDVNFENSFANQVLNYGRSGDALLGITTSGNSKNVVLAAKVARDKNMKVIGLTGRDGGAMKDISDVCIIVPEAETYKIQELHLPIYHALCLELEDHFFKE